MYLMEKSHFNCLCSQCSSGHGLKSKTFQLDPYPESMYRSQYMLNFQARSGSQAPPFGTMSNFLPQAKVDFTSTYQTEFIPHQSKPSSSQGNLNARSSSAPQIKYANSTTYSNSFTNHKAKKFPIMTGIYIDHRKKGLRVGKRTVYSEEFKEKTGSFVKIENPNIKLSQTAQLGFEYPRVTTAQREYKDLSKYIEKKSRFKPYEMSFKLKSCEAQYLSTHKREFILQDSSPALQNFELCLKKSQTSKANLKREIIS